MSFKPSKSRAKSRSSQSICPDIRPAIGPTIDSTIDFQRRQDALQEQILTEREKRAERARERAAERERAFGDLCEASEGRAVVWRRENWSPVEMLEAVGNDAWMFNCLMRWTRHEATRRIDRQRHAERRPFYYAREKERRQALAAERRKVARRTTDNPCPTPELLLDAWEAAQESHEGVLRFGSLMEDLACYVDSGLMRTEEGEIYGRRGGIKAWLREYLPALFLKYKTVMAYKAAARKAKQLTGLADPTPAARLVEAPKPEDPLELVRAKAVYREIIGAPVADASQTRNEATPPDGTVTQGLREPRSRTAWLERIEAFANPERVTEATTLEAWKRKYESEITVRTKSKWVARIWRRWRGNDSNGGSGRGYSGGDGGNGNVDGGNGNGGNGNGGNGNGGNGGSEYSA